MATINVRVDETVKKDATALLESLGLDMTTAVNLYLRQIIIRGGIPFDVRKPNVETLAAIEEVEKMRRGELQTKGYNTFAELVKEIKDEIAQEEEENV